MHFNAVFNICITKNFLIDTRQNIDAIQNLMYIYNFQDYKLEQANKCYGDCDCVCSEIYRVYQVHTGYAPFSLTRSLIIKVQDSIRVSYLLT